MLLPHTVIASSPNDAPASAPPASVLARSNTASSIRHEHSSAGQRTSHASAR